MSKVLRHNRKSSDEEILRLNSIGLSLQTISTILGCHPTSITLRLKTLKVPPADTRRAFMEDIFSSLPEGSRDVVADLLSDDPSKNIKGYVRDLMLKDIEARQAPKVPNSSQATPTNNEE
jgi:hypothetical protein